jgi:hypothetical protein
MDMNDHLPLAELKRLERTEKDAVESPRPVPGHNIPGRRAGNDRMAGPGLAWEVKRTSPKVTFHRVLPRIRYLLASPWLLPAERPIGQVGFAPTGDRRLLRRTVFMTPSRVAESTASGFRREASTASAAWARRHLHSHPIRDGCRSSPSVSIVTPIVGGIIQYFTASLLDSDSEHN